MADHWQDVRRATLSPQRAQEIAARVHYGRLDEHAGFYAPTDPVFDASSLRLGDATRIINCYASCRTAPSEVQGAMDYARATLLDELYDEGVAVDGPMRIALIKYNDGQTKSSAIIPLEWPLGPMPDELAIAREDPQLLSYTGRLTSSEADVQALRNVRAQLSNGAFGSLSQWQAYSFFWIWGDTMTFYYQLRFRDVIPMEDENGEVQMDFSSLIASDAADAGG